MVSWRVSAWRSEPMRNTLPNAGWRRDAVALTVPLAETIESGGTYTGRPASSGRVKRGVWTRFKSWNPYWLMPRAYVASTERVYAPKGCSCTPTDPRHVRGALNVGSKTMTSGCGGGAAAVVSAQLVGIAAGFAA